MKTIKNIIRIVKTIKNHYKNKYENSMKTISKHKSSKKLKNIKL